MVRHFSFITSLGIGRPLAIACALALVAGCGVKGPLTLPSPATTPVATMPAAVMPAATPPAATMSVPDATPAAQRKP